MFGRVALALQGMFGRVALALRGKLVVTALAAALLIGGGSVAVAAATQGRILDLSPTVQPTHTQEPNGDNDNDEHCEATPAATPSAGHECADNDEDNDEDNDNDEHGNGQNGNGQNGNGQNGNGQNGNGQNGNGGNGNGTPTPWLRVRQDQRANRRPLWLLSAAHAAPVYPGSHDGAGGLHVATRHGLFRTLREARLMPGQSRTSSSASSKHT